MSQVIVLTCLSHKCRVMSPNNGLQHTATHCNTLAPFYYLCIHTDGCCNGVIGPRIGSVGKLVYSYGVATISRLLKIIGLFCRISCVL